MSDAPSGAGLPTRRLFFALWPSDELRERIARRTHALVRASGGRAIPPGNFHVTVVFVGHVLESRVDAVLQAGAAAAAAEFDLTLDRIESWPGSNVLCLTTGVTPAEMPRNPRRGKLTHLVDSLRFRLLEQQIRLKRQVFRPHITLIRYLPRQRPAQAVEPFEWHAKEFVLVDSSVSHRGSEYRVIGRWPLRSPAGDE